MLSFCPDVFAQYNLIQNFLCELGIKYYSQGRYDLALKEFQKALILNPDSEVAKEFIKKIEEAEISKISPERIPPQEIIPEIIPKKEVLSREEIIRRELEALEVKPEILPLEAKILPPVALERLILDEKVLATQPQTKLEIELEKSMIISGKEISRWLVTAEDIISIERESPNEIKIKGENMGITYLHVWDNQGRWTFLVQSIPPKPIGPTLEEELRLAEEKAATFKLRYNLDWYSYEQGRRLDELGRTSYSYSHHLKLDGQTPYGNLDSTIDVRRLKTSTDLTYVTLGLREGKFGPFKDFNLKGFDYSPGFSNLSFSATTLRGVMLESPAFDRKVNYTTFWGREGGGRYGGLSPGLAEIKDSFLGGLDLNFTPSKKLNYGLSVIRGWGRDREAYLKEYSYDLDVDYYLKNFGLSYETAYDSEVFGHLIGVTYNIPKLKLTAELRNIDKDFLSISGYGWRRGEIGGLFTLGLKPTEDLHISSRLDIFKDRLYPSPEKDDRYNIDYNFDTTWALDSLTSLRFDYSIQNQLGRISSYRSQTQGIGISRAFDWIRRINTYLNYRYQESKHFGAPSLDFINDKISLGLRFSIISDLYYFLNKEFNWLEERYTATHAGPSALETGFDWYGQILKTPFYGTFRLLYRDEEDTISALSFLSGEDYLEGYGELSYRPNPDRELYFSTRFRNIWADNPNTTKRMETDFRAGIRYLWDTGVRWESIGEIEGFCFKDINSDGTMQSEEEPLEGIKLWLGKNRFCITDDKGYYRFPKVKARKAYISIDPVTIPSGFVLSSPATQEASITHGKKVRLDFGITFRSEIYGFIFEDKDGDGKFGLGDLGIRGAVLVLEDGSKAITDDRGEYFFRKTVPGRHTLTLDINTIPLVYLPAIPILKDIELFEGASYNYNIPLKRIQD